MGAGLNGPAHEDGPPLVPPRPRVDTLHGQPETEHPVTTTLRKDSPPAGIHVQGRGWKLSVPAVAVTALLTTIAAVVGTKAVDKATNPDDVTALRQELREFRKDVSGLRSEIGELREEQQAGRSADRALLNYTERSVTLLARTMRELGAKVDVQGRPTLEPLDLLPAPLPGSDAPAVQPREALPAAPRLP
jgi:hypothetical protein